MPKRRVSSAETRPQNPLTMNAKRLLLLLTLFSAMLNAFCARSAARRCVPAAEVQIYAMGVTNFRVEALNIDPLLAARPFPDAPASRKESKALAEQWRSDFAPALVPVGAADAYAARRALNAAVGLWVQTGLSDYADAVETLLFNGLTAALRYPRDPIERHVAASALLDGVGAAFGSDDEAVYVNYYIGSGAHVCDAKRDLRLDVLTALPADGRVRVRVRGMAANGTRECLRLRLPSWAGACPVVRVNGRETDVRLVRGYIEIDRRWNNGDEVFFELPLTPRVICADGRAAILLGPMAYACPAGMTDVQFLTDEPLRLDDIEGSDLYAVVVRAISAEGNDKPFEVALLPYALTRSEVWLPASR